MSTSCCSILGSSIRSTRMGRRIWKRSTRRPDPGLAWSFRSRWPGCRNRQEDQGAGPDDGDQFAGNPGGFVVQIKNGPTLYHTGDTNVFGDMAAIGRSHKIDYMLVCIGDHFTMGPEGAADAVRL